MIASEQNPEKNQILKKGFLTIFETESLYTWLSIAVPLASSSTSTGFTMDACRAAALVWSSKKGMWKDKTKNAFKVFILMRIILTSIAVRATLASSEATPKATWESYSSAKEFGVTISSWRKLHSQNSWHLGWLWQLSDLSVRPLSLWMTEIDLSITCRTFTIDLSFNRNLGVCHQSSKNVSQDHARNFQNSFHDSYEDSYQDFLKRLLQDCSKIGKLLSTGQLYLPETSDSVFKLGVCLK